MKKVSLLVLVILLNLFVTGCTLVDVGETQKQISDDVAINKVIDELQGKILDISQTSSLSSVEKLESLFTKKVIFDDGLATEELFAGEYLLSHIYIPIAFQLPRIKEYKWDKVDIVLEKQMASVEVIGFMKAETDQYVYKLHTTFIFEKSPEGIWLIRKISPLFPQELL